MPVEGVAGGKIGKLTGMQTMCQSVGQAIHKILSGKVKKVRAKAKSRSERAGLILPVARIHRFLRNGGYSKRVSADAAVFATASIEYLISEILELAGNVAQAHKKTRILPRHIMLAIRNDIELDQLMHGAVISNSGTRPSINMALLPGKRVVIPKNMISPIIHSQEY